MSFFGRYAFTVKYSRDKKEEGNRSIGDVALFISILVCYCHSLIVDGYLLNMKVLHGRYLVLQRPLVNRVVVRFFIHSSTFIDKNKYFKDQLQPLKLKIGQNF